MTRYEHALREVTVIHRSAYLIEMQAAQLMDASKSLTERASALRALADEINARDVLAHEPQVTS